MSTVGSALAARFGYRFFDTGAMYRAMIWLALERDVDVRDEAALAALAGGATITVRESPIGAGEATTVLLDGEDATPHLRDAVVEANVSLVSRVPGVRQALVRIQRDLADGGGVVMAGRDIGSVVLPDADIKVYLDASREVRARRRAEQMGGEDAEAAYDAILSELVVRDRIDSSRAASPLTAAAGAVIITTDALSIEEVVRRIAALAPA